MGIYSLTSWLRFIIIEIKKGTQAYILVDTTFKFAQTSLIRIDLIMGHLIPMDGFNHFPYHAIEKTAAIRI